MKCAYEFAELSHCSRGKVGVVITPTDLSNIVAIGYNGNHRGGKNGCDRPDEKGNCGCLHAEDNALIKAPYGNVPLVLFTTTAPCVTCAKRILNSDVVQVVYSEDYHSDGIKLLTTHGITAIRIPLER